MKFAFILQTTDNFFQILNKNRAFRAFMCRKTGQSNEKR